MDMSKDSLIALARTIAGKYELDPAHVCAIIEQESGWNPWAVRYEPEFLSRYIAPLYTAGRISATEAYTRSMSWGLMQVMGQTAREKGFAGADLSTLCDPETGIDIGCKLFAALLARQSGNVTNALLAWNGGSDKGYPSEVLARISTYST